MPLSIETERPTLRLAEYVAEARYEALPDATLHAARRSLINFLGVTIGGSHHEEVDATLRALAALGTTGTVPVLGRTERLDAASAALVNGIGSAVLDFDSTQMKRTNIHPSGPVLPALLALAATRTISGRDFMNAFVLGVEVACRIANGVLDERNPGWHVTGITGGIGAAVAVSKILELDPPRIVAAIGIAANQAAGLREMYGTACKALTPGRAARDGLLSAMMAEQGFSAPDRPIEGKKALARVFMGRDVPENMIAGLGESYEIDLNIFKPYPCAIVVHAVIDGVIQLCRKHDLASADIASIELGVAPIALELAGHMDPRTELQTKFSLTHGAAVAAMHRSARNEYFTEEAAVGDPLLRSLRERVTSRPRDGFRKDQADVRIVLHDGRSLELHVEHALGSLHHPMSDDDIAEKFLSLTVPVLGRERAESLLAFAGSIAKQSDVSPITGL
jgi:2-methylcitrate dehydratase PrpD